MYVSIALVCVCVCVNWSACGHVCKYSASVCVCVLNWSACGHVCKYSASVCVCVCWSACGHVPMIVGCHLFLQDLVLTPSVS